MDQNGNPSSRRCNTLLTRPIEVAAALIFRSGKLLITQRHADSHLGGLWEFPGGKREPGETFEQCLCRELREELGCNVEVLELVESITHNYPEKSVLLRFHRCRWLAHEPQPLDCAAVRWVSRLELEQFKFPAADAQLLGRLTNEDSFWAGA